MKYLKLEFKKNYCYSAYFHFNIIIIVIIITIQAVAENIANYQPTIAQLNQAVERLRNLGQISEAEEILRVTSQYEMLGDQVRQQTQKCQKSVASRQQLEDQMKEIDNLVKSCEDSADSVIGLQVPVPDKINKLKVKITHLIICYYILQLSLHEAIKYGFFLSFPMQQIYSIRHRKHL